MASVWKTVLCGSALSLGVLGLPCSASSVGSLDVQVQNRTEAQVNAGRDVMLSTAQVTQSVNAGRDVLGTSSTVAGSLNAGRDVTLSASSVQGSLSAGRSLKINHVGIYGPVTVGENATLTHSNLFAPVTFAGHGVLDHARLSDSLTVGDTHLMVFDSQLKSIRVTQTQSALSIQTNGVVVSSGSGRSTLQVGPGSQSLVNGYTVRATDTATVVITPDLLIYENGQLKGGRGPKTYADYLSQNPQAPWVKGPGWSAQLSESGASPRDSESAPVVEVMGESVIDGDVVFEGPQGEVILHAPAKLLGQVVGGRLTRANHP